METTRWTGPRPALRAAGAWLLGGSALWWAAAAFLIPDDDFFHRDTARQEALAIAEHTAEFRGFHLLAAAGTAAAAVGVVLAGRALRARRPSRLADLAAAMAGVGLVAWLVEVGLRLSRGVSRAEQVAVGLRAPDAEPAVGTVATYALSALAFAAPVVCAWALARAGLPGRRTAVVVAALVTLAGVASVAMLAPSVVFQFGVAGLGAVLLLHRPARVPVAGPAAAADA